VPTLVDAGVGDPAHLDAIAAALAGASLQQVLITHRHVDHTVGIPALKQRWGQILILAGSSDEVLSAQSFTENDRSKSRSDPGLSAGGSPRIVAGAGFLTAVHTPGHSPDHYCFFDEAAGDVYCGDLARANGTIVIPGSRGGNLRQYLDSLQRIRDLRPRRLLPGHGPIVTEPAALIDGYLAHRADREAQLVEALRHQALTPQEIVPRIYGRLTDTIEAAAAESVLAHLIKLEEDGIARCSDDGRWERVKGDGSRVKGDG
jgi:glyoxylase-like metal-dependent hydrolase (beta-lactamase superfamily II)